MVTLPAGQSFADLAKAPREGQAPDADGQDPGDAGSEWLIGLEDQTGDARDSDGPTAEERLLAAAGASAEPTAAAILARKAHLWKVRHSLLSDAHGSGPDGLLFTSVYGGALKVSSFNGGAWRKAVAEAKSPDGMTMHWLRHYYASRLIRFGESVKTVQARLGRATAAETLNTYGHLWPDSDDRTREAASGAVRGNDRSPHAAEQA